MLEIRPVLYVTVKSELLGVKTKCPAVWDEINGHGAAAVPERRPFVQISYDEISGDELDRLFDFNGIARANKPVGLPCEFDAFTWGSASGMEVLLFPLSGLCSHFEKIAPEICSAYEASGSMDRFVAIRGDAMTATEYLVAGSMECISFCVCNRLCLAFQW